MPYLLIEVGPQDLTRHPRSARMHRPERGNTKGNTNSGEYALSY